MYLFKLLQVSFLGVTFAAATLSGAAVALADGSDPQPKPPMFADGSDPQPKPPMFADGSDPQPKPPMA
jgi:hypothetical protein